MFCTKCGAKLEPDAKDCKKCGQAVSNGDKSEKSNQSLAQPAATPISNQPAAKPKSGFCGSCAAVLAIIIITIILIATFSNYSKNNSSNSSSDGSGSSTTTPKSNSNSKSQDNSTSGQTAPSTQTTKQLYYSASCSNCQSEVCQRSYNYSGYDAGFYQYYKDLCDSCTCADKKSSSVWK